MAKFLTGDEFSCELCEEKEFLGSAGHCDEQNTTCTCPPGFSGKDDWFTFDTSCHVKVCLQFRLQVFALVSSIIGLLVCICALIDLTRRWKYSLFVTADSTKSSRFGTGSQNPRDYYPRSRFYSIESGQDQVGSSRSRQKKLKFFHDARHRHMASYLAVVAYTLCCGIYITYLILQLAGINRGKGRWYMDIITMLTLITVLNGIYGFFYSAYLTLPNLSRYGAVVGVHNVLVKNPNLVPKILKIVVVMINCLYLIFALIQIFYEPARRIVDMVQLGIYPLTLLPAFLLETFFVFEIEQLLKRSKEALGNDAESVEGGTINAISDTLIAAKWLRLMILVPSAVITVIAILSTAFKARYEYLFYNLAIGTVALGVALTALLHWRYTDGGLVPRFDRASHPKTKVKPPPILNAPEPLATSDLHESL